ncbi:MAG: sugar ABC transporter ATP-binding protein [Bacillota bacterium]|mgnify:CR=1 FL=1|nr:sugar ABC transporter ATP-binding protein [Bacillota bacterium]NLL60474.1 sugar ABC transporter ATP-binding protein [Tissierellia bacterium]
MEQKIIVNMKNITMSFSGNKVLDNVNFDLRRGEVHSIMGANGAGKSTLIKILNGIYNTPFGEIEIDGKKVNIKTPSDAEKYGLAFVHQELNVCNDMTVAENMYIGNWIRDKYGLYDKKATSEKAKELLNIMGVSIDPDVPVRRLRTAEKQIIEILKTLTREAKVVILDEPTSSLNEAEKENFFGILERMKKKGVSIIFISHFLEDVFRLSDRVTVLKDGLNNGVFYRGHYTKDDLVVAMMGKKIANEVSDTLTISEDAPVILELQNFTSEKKFSNVSIKIHKGDIVGVCGLLGAGKTELAKAIFGIDDYDSGKLFLYGEEIKKPRPDLMIKKKVALLTEERKLEGFIPLMSIKENTTLSIMKTLANKLGIIYKSEQERFANNISEQMTIKMSSINQSVISLSGGNQQKVVIAKCLASEPKLFLLDEPTRGVDVYAKSEIYKILRDFAEKGTTIIIFSSELEELLANCSKIIVLKKGQVVDEVSAKNLTKNSLLSMIG